MQLIMMEAIDGYLVLLDEETGGYRWPGRWLTRRNLVLLSIPCLLTLVLALTNDLHHLVWRGFVLYDGEVTPLRGPVNWVIYLYAYGLGILGLVVFAWLFLRSPQHRRPVVIMIIGLLAGRVHFIVDTVQIFPPELTLDIPPVAFEYLIYAIALFGFHILDPSPLARQTAIEQMQAGPAIRLCFD